MNPAFRDIFHQSNRGNALGAGRGERDCHGEVSAGHVGIWRDASRKAETVGVALSHRREGTERRGKTHHPPGNAPMHHFFPPFSPPLAEPPCPFPTSTVYPYGHY